MLFLLDWTSPFPIKKRYPHLRGSLIRYSNINYSINVHSMHIHPSNYCTNFFFLQPLRLLILAVNRLPYFLMILITTCAPLTKRCSAHLRRLRFQLPMRSTNIWESQKPSFSVRQVPQKYIKIICTFSKLFYLTMISVVQIQSTVELFATQMSLSLPTSVQ